MADSDRFDDLADFCAWWIGPDVVLHRYHLSRPLKEPPSRAALAESCVWLTGPEAVLSPYYLSRAAKEAAPPPGDASHAAAAEPVFVPSPPCQCNPGRPGPTGIIRAYRSQASPLARANAWAIGYLKIGGIPQPPLEVKGAFRGSSVDDVRAAAERLLRMLPRIEEPDEAAAARHSLHAFLDGSCLSCQVLLGGAKFCPGGDGILRAICAEFDRAGVRLPKALREWSAASRFKARPPRTGKRGQPPRTYRNGFAVNAMALLAFLTDRRVTRDPTERFDPEHPDAGEGDPSLCSIMATTWAARKAGLTERNLARLWDETKDAGGDRVGPYLLKSWRSGQPAPRLSYPDSPVLEGGIWSP